MTRIFSPNRRFALGCLLAWLALCSSGWAQTTTFTYQGSLSNGGNLANGSYDLQFKLYDQLTGGTLQGSPNTVTVSNVTVTAGVFTVGLDFGAAAFPGAARYLEICVRPAGSGSFTTLAPRQQLTSTPYAIRSLSAGSTTNFSGSLSGDVTGTQGATVVSLVGGVSASNIASGATAANNATNANTPSTIVKRDGSGNFTAGTITATSFSGSGASLTNLNASNISSGTLLDSLLPSNLARLNAAQIFTANQTINANLIQSGTLVQFTPTNGLVAGGTEGSGAIPATGAGVRLMWYPKKYAFRAGKLDNTGNTYWDDANVGSGSTAFGFNTRASGTNSFAAGDSANASGQGSVAFSLGVASGQYSFAHYGTANGTKSIAIGEGTLASGAGAVALGSFAQATNDTAVALGSCTANGDGATCLGTSKATGDWSTTIGHWVSSSSNSSNTTTYRGVLAFGDFSGGVGNSLYATADNQFNARAAGGYRFFASSDTSDNTKPGLFISGTTGNTQINGNLTVSGTITGTFSGSLAGDVTGTQSATVVSTVGGVTATNVASGATAANNATNANTASTIVKRDASGNFSAGTITASLNGNATSATTATNFTGSLAGDVTGTQSATVVSTVGGVSSSNVASGATAANNATSSNTANTIVKRDSSGNFAAGTITATAFSGSGASLTNLNASNISGGMLLDSLLSSNVAKLNAAQTFTANQTINANLTQSGTLVQFTPTDGLLVGGTLGSGIIPATGAGTRMMWYPGKAAFRAGRVNGTAWDTVGSWSFATGWDNKASGNGSAAFGSTNTASGANSFSSGAVNSASGDHSVAMGFNNFVSGRASVALGYQNDASGEYSIALGSHASTNEKTGSFVYGDQSTDEADNTDITATADNQFSVRAAGGLRFFASSNTSDEAKPGLFISGTTGNTQINGNLTVSGSILGTISGGGGSITNLNATNISSGTLDDTHLSANVALKNTANTFTANQTINANLTQSGTLVQFTPTNGLVAGGTFGIGTIPAAGGGTRMMWYPAKAAFRAGSVSGTQWDVASIGNYSFAVGSDAKASGDHSIAIGRNATASGAESVALSNTSTASGSNSFASGFQSTASGNFSVALGYLTTASGTRSTVMGSNASSNGKVSSFVYGDGSTTDTISATQHNQFVVRAQNMWFGIDNNVTATAGRFLETSTGAYLTTGGTWTNSSSRALKTNFAPINARAVLQQVLQLPIQTWNYKAEDAKVRHIGAISQDFHQLFGFGDSAESIATVDADGVALAAIQGLHEELQDRDAKLAQQQQELGQLKQQIKAQQAMIDGLRQLICAQQPQAEVCKIR